ncbi:MAG TPA: hypothetical protein VKA50_00335 [Gammaproteobacteria bacterium]|nr:hypothetical protein [Gammaproteobacteria bacterium]
MGVWTATILFLAALAGCVHTPARYETIADATLQRDVMQAIGAYEAASGGDAHPVLVSARPAKTHGRRPNGPYTELWTVESNGRRSTYRVTFVPEPGAGTTYSITRLPAPVPDGSTRR